MNFCVVLVFCPSKSVGVPWRSGGGGRLGPTSTLDAVTYPLSISVEEGLTGDTSGPEIIVLCSTSGLLTNTIFLDLHFCLLSWQVDPGLDTNTIFSLITTQKELGRYLIPVFRRKYKTIRHLKKYPP